jgi:hypothetical protein
MEFMGMKGDILYWNRAWKGGREEKRGNAIEVLK